MVSASNSISKKKINGELRLAVFFTHIDLCKEKNIIPISALLILGALSSCDKTDEHTYVDTTYKNSQNSTSEDITFNEWSKADASPWLNWKRSPQSAQTRNTTTDYTVYGYTTESRSKRKARLGKELASRVGLANSIYVAERVTAKYELTIAGLSSRKVRFSSLDSPECGLYPDFTDEELDLRGYSLSQKSDNITLATMMIHIISDTAGRTYDKWYPCKPSQLKWCYNVYTID